ncbi:hypothetical protein V6N13_099561 [Hibiscus sabdariffa]|uniref:Uncharacterized protein n=1 Tax=Hibiscus sabdariffa TaxID=183260 RepID=A0ABR2Q033_9ROSI
MTICSFLVADVIEPSIRETGTSGVRDESTEKPSQTECKIQPLSRKIYCRFNHPNPTTTGACDPPSEYAGGSVSSQAVSRANMVPWSLPRALNETAAYMPVMFSPPQVVVPPPNLEWKGYQSLASTEFNLELHGSYLLSPPISCMSFLYLSCFHSYSTMYLLNNHLVVPSEDDCMPPTGQKFACNSSICHEQPENLGL